MTITICNMKYEHFTINMFIIIDILLVAMQCCNKKGAYVEPFSKDSNHNKSNTWHLTC